MGYHAFIGDKARNFIVNDYRDGAQRDFSDNKVRTSKYTVLNFLPTNLFIQFTKFANLYFLFLCILQVIPSVTNTDGRPTVAYPLAIVVFISAVKDLFEDRQRAS